MQHRRTGALIGAALLVTLAACGTASDGAPSTDSVEVPAATQAPADDGITEAEPQAAESTPTETTPTETTDETEPVDTDAAPATEPVPEDPPAEPGATDPPEAVAPAEPIVGGRLFASEVQPDSAIDTNPFPDLVVDDIGKDAKVNIRNIVPSDRPVLLWAWAPH